MWQKPSSGQISALTYMKTFKEFALNQRAGEEGVVHLNLFISFLPSLCYLHADDSCLDIFLIGIFCVESQLLAIDH